MRSSLCARHRGVEETLLTSRGRRAGRGVEPQRVRRAEAHARAYSHASAARGQAVRTCRRAVHTREPGRTTPRLAIGTSSKISISIDGSDDGGEDRRRCPKAPSRSPRRRPTKTERASRSNRRGGSAAGGRRRQMRSTCSKVGSTSSHLRKRDEASRRLPPVVPMDTSSAIETRSTSWPPAPPPPPPPSLTSNGARPSSCADALRPAA